VIPLLLLIFGTAIAIGLWRKAGPVEWIWLLFGAAITMLVLWVLLVLFVVGPEMRRNPIRSGQARSFHDFPLSEPLRGHPLYRELLGRAGLPLRPS
jgi:hypothetical protein